ncbi:hypothetical protein IQ273_01765 [Nodosilinea sp. LEGE 07298]|uniref:hypothetical protein n=1 Tax=Nodosilinea sp. LEGE 07298 TaxID=2777970 RepID=UPI0018805C9F|nr:hypothetical protein [Nodosilinea sp. LEGE 07298]MBE9108149.1 hypothetical protein [Nodosilinea sp. LEGE 07298]
MTTGTENGNGAAIAPNTVDLLLDEGDLDRDELYELSVLVGIDPENAPSYSAALGDESLDGVATDPDSEDAEELVDRDVLAGRVHADGKTRTPIWANPLVKAGSVALIGGLCMAVVGGVLSGFQSAGKRDLTPTARPEQAPEPPPDPTQLALERQRQEIGQLKTRNALGNQTQALQLHEARTNGEGNDPSAAELLALRNQMARAQAEQEGGAQPAPNAQTAAAVSPQAMQPTGPVTRPAPTYAPAAPRPAPAPRPSASSPPRQPVVNRPPPPAPEVLWASLAAMGSYGTGTGMEPAFTPGSQEPTPVASTPLADSPQQPAAAGPTAQLVSNPPPASLQIEEAAILGRTLKRVAPGTTAAAKLVAPIYWAEDLSREQQSQRTAIALSQPLLADNGAVALDVGTVLVAEVSVLAGSGMVELSVTDVVTGENGVSKVTPVPLNHLLITGGNGNPLIAKEMRNGGEVRAAQMQLAALGALGHVGELLNRPLSQQTIIGEGASAVATEYAPVNIIAGLLSGAAQAVLPIEQQRVTQRIDDYDSRNRIWFHDTAEVSVFALNEFVFEP